MVCAVGGVEAHITGRRGEQSLRRVSMSDLAANLDELLAVEQIPPAPVEVNYASNMVAFQAAYDAAKARIRAGQGAVEFLPEGGVTGGAAAPGGRGFGAFRPPRRLGGDRDGLPHREGSRRHG